MTIAAKNRKVPTPVPASSAAVQLHDGVDRGPV